MAPDYYQQLMKRLMLLGLRITMFIDEDALVWFDLNTGMKSHLHVRYDEIKQTMLYKARYSNFGQIDDWGDLKYIAKECMCGDDFAAYVWFDILQSDLEPK